jgi:hypothetical protein
VVPLKEKLLLLLQVQEVVLWLPKKRERHKNLKKWITCAPGGCLVSGVVLLEVEALVEQSNK